MVCCHLVAIAAADLLVGEVPAILELTDDLLHRAHRDSDRMGDVSLSELGVAVDRDEDVGLIGEERPGWKVRFGFDQVHAQTVPTLSGGTVDPVGSVVPAGLLSHLACHPLEDGTWMPDHEVAGMVSQLLVAGHETTTSLITNAVWRLLEDRSRWERLVAEPTLVPNVLEESLRFDPPVLGSRPMIGPPPIKEGERAFALSPRSLRELVPSPRPRAPVPQVDSSGPNFR